jgi:hypothetical protein
MAVAAGSPINWSALWKIAAAALIGGAGVVIVYALLLLFLRRARAARSPGARFGDYALAGLCGLFCVATVVIGIYAMTRKPSSTKPKVRSAAVLIAPGHQTRLVAEAA